MPAVGGAAADVVDRRRSLRDPLDEADTFAERVAEATSPIDDVRGSAAYRRHAIRVLTDRALARTLSQ